jgi:hypothetical protein
MAIRGSDRSDALELVEHSGMGPPTDRVGLRSAGLGSDGAALQPGAVQAAQRTVTRGSCIRMHPPISPRAIPVGTRVTPRPPDRSERALLTHSAPRESCAPGSHRCSSRSFVQLSPLPVTPRICARVADVFAQTLRVRRRNEGRIRAPESGESPNLEGSPILPSSLSH